MQMIAAVTIGSGNRAETFEEAEGLVPFPAHMVVFEAIRSESVDTAMIFKMAFFFFRFAGCRLPVSPIGLASCSIYYNGVT